MVCYVSKKVGLLSLKLILWVSSNNFLIQILKLGSESWTWQPLALN